MINQEKLIQKINNFTIETLPHSILLLGDRGSGHEEICDYIGNRFSLGLFDMTGIDNFKEFLDTIPASSTPTLYTINLLEFNDSKDIKQNALLKLYEDPGDYSYFIIYGEDDSHILDTIRNRSYLLKMEKFNRESLEPLVTGDMELTLSLCNTPGQIEIANHSDLNSMYSLCKNIVDNIGKAGISNTLTISDKINFKDEYSKYDLFLFIRCLGNCLIEKITEDKSYIKMYNCLHDMNNKIWIVLNKKQQFENFLINIWNVTRNSLQI